MVHFYGMDWTLAKTLQNLGESRTVEHAAETLAHDLFSCNWVAKSAKVVEIVFCMLPT
jgi:hypothetical protein